MTASPARIAANQQNAQRSTGPKTDEGKARSRLNACRHGLAGSGDIIGPGEDLALIDQRTAAFIRELAAPGSVGELLARRAAVLSVRMEKAADREVQAVAASAQTGVDQFDRDRVDQLDAWLVEAEKSERPDLILARLEADPEGLAALGESWRSLRAAVARDDAASTARAALWLGLVTSGGATSAQLLPEIDAEIARLDHRLGSPLIQEAARHVTNQRREAGLIASFDPSPEATLARRYEAAAERGMYRAMRAIQELRRDGSSAALDLIPPSPPHPTPPSIAATPARAVSPEPPPIPPMGSFRPDRASIGVGRVEPPFGPAEPRPRRPDLRKLAANRR